MLDVGWVGGGVGDWVGVVEFGEFFALESLYVAPQPVVIPSFSA